MTFTQPVLRGPANVTQLIIAQKEQSHYASVLGSKSGDRLDAYARQNPTSSHHQPRPLPLSNRQKGTMITTVPPGPGGTSMVKVVEGDRPTRRAATKVEFELIDLTDEEDNTSGSPFSVYTLPTPSQNALGETIDALDCSAPLQRAKNNHRKRLEFLLNGISDLGPLMNQTTNECSAPKKQANSVRKKEHNTSTSISGIDQDTFHQLLPSALLGEGSKSAELDDDQQIRKNIENAEHSLTSAGKTIGKSNCKDKNKKLELAQAAAAYEKSKAGDGVPESAPLFATGQHLISNTHPYSSKPTKTFIMPTASLPRAEKRAHGLGLTDHKSPNVRANIAKDSTDANTPKAKRFCSNPSTSQPAAAVYATPAKFQGFHVVEKAQALVQFSEEYALGKRPLHPLKKRGEGRPTEVVEGSCNNIHVTVRGGDSFLGQTTVVRYGQKWVLEIGHNYRKMVIPCMWLEAADLGDSKIQFSSKNKLMNIPLSKQAHLDILKHVFAICKRHRDDICGTPGTLKLDFSYFPDREVSEKNRFVDSCLHICSRSSDAGFAATMRSMQEPNHQENAARQLANGPIMASQESPTSQTLPSYGSVIPTKRKNRDQGTPK